jgi:sporulation protein YlmC with PRC-barrel domain
MHPSATEGSYLFVANPKEMSAMAEPVLERRVRETVQEWYMSGDDMIGKDVTNELGEDLGEISDLRVTMPQGRVDYVVLKYGGLLGKRYFAIPPEALAYRPSDKTFVVNIRKDRLDDASGFSEDNWPREADWSLIESGRPFTPPSREEAEAVERTESPPPEVITTERVEVREPPRRKY